MEQLGTGLGSPGPQRQREWEFLPDVINPPGWERAARESYFVERDPSCVKYIDDSLIVEKVNMKRPPLLTEAGPDGAAFKDVNPSKTQDLFDHIIRSAEEKRMIVNGKKTGLLCVSAATSFEARAHICTGVGEKVESVERIKVLVFL